MEKIKRQIPNFITLCNLLCGVIACWQAVQGRLQYAAIFMLFGIVFDFFDGLGARLLKVASPIGKELDSLADLVTSGVAPAFILFNLLLHAATPNWIAFVALLIPLASAYRLAKFNLDTRQSHSFRGLPTPANAIVWASIGFCFVCPGWMGLSLLPMRGFYGLLFGHTGCLVMAIVALIGCVLMVSDLPLFGLKFKSLKWKDNYIKYIFLIISVLTIVLFGVLGLAIAVGEYIILALATIRKGGESAD